MVVPYSRRVVPYWLQTDATADEERPDGSDRAKLLDDIAGGMTAHELERDDVDFKEDDRSAEHTVKLLVDACLCFANASGGTRTRRGGPRGV